MRSIPSGAQESSWQKKDLVWALKVSQLIIRINANVIRIDFLISWLLSSTEKIDVIFDNQLETDIFASD